MNPDNQIPIKNSDLSSDEELKKENLVEIHRIVVAFSQILKNSAIDMSELIKIVDENNKINNLGKKASEILQTALTKFEENCGDLFYNKYFFTKKHELDAIIDTSLNSIFLSFSWDCITCCFIVVLISSIPIFSFLVKPNCRV